MALGAGSGAGGSGGSGAKMGTAVVEPVAPAHAGPAIGGSVMGPGANKNIKLAGSGTGLQSVLDTLSDLNHVGNIQIPNIPKASAPAIQPTNVEKVKIPAFLNLQDIRSQLMTGLDLATEGERAQTKDFLARTGFGDSTLATSSMGDIERKRIAGQGGINKDIFGMSLAEQGLYQQQNAQQAAMDQQRRVQDVLNSIQTGEFNIEKGLQAAQIDMQSALDAAGLAADVIMKDYYIMLQEDQGMQDAFSQFIEGALG